MNAYTFYHLTSSALTTELVGESVIHLVHLCSGTEIIEMPLYLQ